MKYLLDTHCWLWWVREPARLGKLTHQTISDPGNRVYLSAASTWEATIKASMGKYCYQAECTDLSKTVLNWMVLSPFRFFGSTQSE